MSETRDELVALAAELGVQSEYWDTRGHLREASSDAIVAVLRAMGAPVHQRFELGELRHHVATNRVRPVEPVHVAHVREPFELDVRVPSIGGPERVVVHLTPDGAEPRRVVAVLDELPVVGRVGARCGAPR